MYFENYVLGTRDEENEELNDKKRKIDESNSEKQDGSTKEPTNSVPLLLFTSNNHHYVCVSSIFSSKAYPASVYSHSMLRQCITPYFHVTNSQSASTLHINYKRSYITWDYFVSLLRTKTSKSALHI